MRRLWPRGKLWEYLEAIILALVLALFIRTFVVQAFKIPSPSMVPTLLVGDHILVNKFLYGFTVPYTDNKVLALRTPDQGDVVVFKYPKNKKMDFIKRCVAVGGDTLQIKEKTLYVNGEKVPDEHAVFLSEGGSSLLKGRDDFGPVTVPEGKIFVMGDNRDNSNDSRFWGFVDISEVKGKAMVIYWSWDRARKWPRFSRIGDVVR
ncbi:MAG: signal peptidase I [bacterium]|nr:MAG: signal peptidase I [bacterium]